MHDTELYRYLLGIEQPWTVEEVKLDLAEQRVEVWAGHKLLMALLAIVPDFGLFGIADEINLGNVVPWVHIGEVVVYGLVRMLIIVVAAHLIFSRREI